MAEKHPNSTEEEEDVKKATEVIFKAFMYKEKMDDQDRDWARVGRALAQIGDDLDAADKLKFDRMISNIAAGSVARNYTVFIDNIRRLVTLIAFATSVTGEVFKDFMRSLLMLWRNPSLAQNISVRHAGQLEVPSEVKGLDDHASKMYLNALQTGKEEVKHIRLMVVGMFGVGKTSVVKNILDEEVSHVESTRGIDVYVNQCYVDESGKWIPRDLESMASSDYTVRLKQIIERNEKSSKSAPTSKEASVDEHQDIEILYQRDAHKQDGAPVQGVIKHEDFMDEHQKERLNTLKHVLESFKHDNDPILVDFTKQIFDATTLPELQSESCEGSQTTVSIWDFAGQYIYYTSHHFFLNSRSIYLLVMNISRSLESKVAETDYFSPAGFMHEDLSCFEAFKFWLKSIHTYTTPEKEEEIIPTVILVGTHKDKIPGTEDEKQTYKEKYFNEALESFIDTPILKHVHPKKFFVNNNSPDEVFECIKDEIVSIAETQAHWKEAVPAKWILLERTIEVMKAEGKEMVTFEEIVQADTKTEFPIKQKEELQLFLKFQHALGNILYFDTEDLKDYIILSPQWIIDVFRCFVSHIPEKNPLQLDMWKEYEDRAILKPTLVDAIIEGNDGNSCFVDYKSLIIKYMEHLDVMAKPSVLLENETMGIIEDRTDGIALEPEPVENDSSRVKESCIKETSLKSANIDSNTSLESQIQGKTVFDTEKLNFHIVPCMLKVRPSDLEMYHLLQPENAKTTPVLCLVFRDGFMPPAVFHRLLAVCIRRWPVSRHGKKFLLYNGLAVFDLTRLTTLTLWFDDNVIYARIALFTQKAKDVESELCKEVRGFIEDMLIKILGIHGRQTYLSIAQNRPFEEYVQCEKVVQPSRGVGLLRVADLVEHDEIKCDAHSSSHSVSRDFALKQWFDKDGVRTHKRLTNKELERVPTEKELNKLSSKIGDEYWSLGIHLGISKARMEQLREQSMHNVHNRIFNVLVEWKQSGENVCLEQLKKVLQLANSESNAFEEVFEYP